MVDYLIVWSLVKIMFSFLSKLECKGQIHNVKECFIFYNVCCLSIFILLLECFLPFLHYLYGREM